MQKNSAEINVTSNNTPLNPTPVTFRNNFSVPVNAQDPWHGDRLHREESAALLTKLLNNSETPFTLVVNSKWGTGKTFFIERWNASIKKEHFSFYFSAWEAELYPSPTIAFVNEFREAIKSDSELYCKVNDLLDDFFVKFLILVIAMPVLLKIGAAKAVELAQGSSLLQGILSLGGDKIQEKYNAALQEKTPTIKEIRKSFQELIEKIQSESSKKAPIYIFIDELDRCRPDFAIRFLEEIKHLFSVPGIVFVLSLDLRQLEGSIKHVYGQHIDCEGYLMRFVNLFYTLPPIDNKRYAEYLLQPLESNCGYQFLTSVSTPDKLFELFAACSKAFSASLRDQIAIRNKLEVLLSTSKIFLYPTVYLLFVQLRYPVIWQRALNDNLFDISPVNLHKTLENYRKELADDFSGKTPTTFDQNSIILFKFVLTEPENETNLLSESIRLLGLNDVHRNELFIQQDKASQNSNSLEKRYWQLIYKNQIDFAKQLDLINLY